MGNEQNVLMRQLFRQQIDQIWQRLKEGETLDNADEAQLGKMMKHHSEYYELWLGR